VRGELDVSILSSKEKGTESHIGEKTFREHGLGEKKAGKCTENGNKAARNVKENKNKTIIRGILSLRGRREGGGAGSKSPGERIQQLGKATW